MKTLFTIAIAALLLGCKEKPNTQRQTIASKLEIERTNIPPQFKIVCDSAGFYAFVTPRGFIWDWRDEISTNRAAVIANAWKHFDYLQRHPNAELGATRKSDWKPCE